MPPCSTAAANPPFRHVTLRLSRPILATVALFVQSWNNDLLPVAVMVFPSDYAT